MSGHSKWAQIKHKKAIADAKRGQVFGKLAKAISVAARGNPDPATNAQLRTVIEKARAVNMPNDNIQRAVSRAGAAEAHLQELLVEIMAPGNVAVLVTALTDNKNRTLTELRTLAGRYGAHVVQEGSLSWMFTRAGVVTVPASSLDTAAREAIELAAIEAGADDTEEGDDDVRILTPADRLAAVAAAVGALAPGTTSELAYVPSSTVTQDPQDAEKLVGLLDALDDHDDVQDVATNAA